MPDLLVLPPQYNRKMVTFSADATGNIFLTCDRQEPKNLGLFNTNLITPEEYEQRFFADMVKDSQTTTKVDDVFRILRQHFPGHDKNIPTNIAGYKRILQDLDAKVSEAVKSQIAYYRNVIRTGTAGNNLQISDARYASWESGMGCKSVCRNPYMETIKTSFASCDSLLKQPYDLLFNPWVTFDESFSSRLGIPDGFKMITKPVDTELFSQKSEVTIQFWNQQPPGDNIKTAVIDNERNTPEARGAFNGMKGEGDIMGNDLKNAEINTLKTRVPLPNPRIKRLFIMKEIGDLGQVKMVFAFLAIMGIDPTQVVMVTTDSVVYLFCILQRVSCIYTGERSGVQSGCCTLRHYLAGPPDYLTKYKNMIEVYAKKIIQHNSSISFALKQFLLDPSSFEYYVSSYPPNVRPRRTLASLRLNQGVRERVNNMIRGFISIIETSQEYITLALNLVKDFDTTTVQQQQQAAAAAVTAAAAAAAAVTAAAGQAAAGQAAAAVAEAGQLETLRFVRAMNDIAGQYNQIFINVSSVHSAGQAAGQAAEAAITTGYNHFCQSIEPFKQVNILTVLPNRRYIMLPEGNLLKQFVTLNPLQDGMNLVANVDGIITGLQAAEAALIQQRNSMRAGGNTHSSCDVGEDCQDYYECLVAYFVYKRREGYYQYLLRRDIVVWMHKPTDNENQLDKQIAFALDYDQIANALIRDHYDPRVTDVKQEFQHFVDTTMVDKLSENQIIRYGKLLLRFLHLAGDMKDENLFYENSLLALSIINKAQNNNIDSSIDIDPENTNRYIIDTRFHTWWLHNRRNRFASNQPPVFTPSINCGNKMDSHNGSKIEPALAIELNSKHTSIDGRPITIKKCYNINTIIKHLFITNEETTLDTLRDIKALAPLPDEYKQNIANFIIMMFRLTPNVIYKLGRYYTKAIIRVKNLYEQNISSGHGGSKIKTIKRKLHYKNRSKNQKRVNKHRITRRNNNNTHRRTRKHRN